MSENDQDSSLKQLIPVLGGISVVVVMGALGYAAVNSLGGTAPPKPPEIQEISLIQPPPPPPPPPKMEEPPPPEMEELEIPEPEPEPIADDAPVDEPLPGDELGLDADGVAGADGFGLKAKKGGRGLIGGGDPNKWYAGVIQSDLQEWLADIDEIRKGRYAAIVKIWISDNGAVQEAQLVQGTGDNALDSAIQRALSAGFSISRAPPEDMPQPVRLRITSRT